MEQIIPANKLINGALGKAKPSAAGYRMMHYTLSYPIEEGTLLLNLLTRELLLLTDEEYSNALGLPELRERWFVVPEDTCEKKLVSMARWLQQSMERKSGRIKSYTILTTMDCNARCFYCYELGRKRIPMTEEIALKVADFIKKSSGGKSVRLNWFGGEPLYNYHVIDVICEKLRQEGVQFKSNMISNGYLFDDEMIQRAITNWNLQQVQITLDGTEEVYNRCKAFIYREGSAYQVVTGNIGRLLDQGISVMVRMNLDFHNADNLLLLADELAERFGGKTGFYAYSHLIFDEKVAWDKRYSLEKWNQLYDARRTLENHMKNLGIGSPKITRINRRLPESQCMADNSEAIVITPDGHLGVCEHFSENELIGHLDSPERNQAVIDSFRAHCDEIPECATCFYYPECIRLKKCPDLIPCIPPERESLMRRSQRAMVNEYELWKKGEQDEAEEIE
ncbi:MAG: 4Fe-4S cluster-binding domain-containing protein [Oscillospiraceae bacterium]|nr:4Fe-4S cluster-binding domain-containing protein [Oscillospiraceae bacterium]